MGSDSGQLISKKRKSAADGSDAAGGKKTRLSSGPTAILQKTSVFGRYLQVITIRIGQGPVSPPAFTIHLGILIERAPAFAEAILGPAAVKECLVEGDGEYRLPTEDHRTFWMFVVWLYTEELVPPPNSILGESVIDTTEVSDARLVRGADLPAFGKWLDEDLVDLYLFGRRNHVDSLSTAVLSLLAYQNDSQKRTTSSRAVWKCFDTALWQSDLIRKYLVDEAEHCLKQKTDLPEQMSLFPPDYISGILRSVLDPTSVVKHSVWQGSQCRYHAHNGTAEQRACEKSWKHQERHGGQASDGPEIYHALRIVSTAFVGPSGNPFVFHRKLVTNKSLYFRKAFSVNLSEAMTNTVLLPEEDSQVFSMFLHWLYTTEIRLPNNEERRLIDSLRPSNHHNDDQLSELASPVSKTELSGQELKKAQLEDEIMIALASSDSQCQQDDLFRLYVFGDRRDARRLRNDCMTEIIQGVEFGLVASSSSTLRINAALKLPQSSKLRSFLVEEAAFLWKEDNDKTITKATADPDFLKQVDQKRINMRVSQAVPPWRQDICLYHEHEAEGEKKECKAASKAWQDEMSHKGRNGLPVYSLQTFRG